MPPRGRGRLTIMAAAVGVVCGASAFRRDHGGAERVRRCAGGAERRTVERLPETAQDLAADARLRLARVDRADVEPALGVVLAQLPAQSQPRLRDRAHATPVPVAYLEHRPP